MKILFLTQKIHQNDDDLAFVILWVQEFIRQGVEVEVICLEKQDFDDSFKVMSLGKEHGNGKLKRILLFFKYIFSSDYDSVYVHMNPEYITLGGWYWYLMRKPIYLWYTHYTMHIHMRMAGLLCIKMFAATKQSMPQFDGNPKKVITGHGIDIPFWIGRRKEVENNGDEHKLVTVHRICRSKRLELPIEAIRMLPQEYTLDIYGRDVDKEYYRELVDLVQKWGLTERVRFNGPVPMHELKDIYPRHRLMINMASETIDKTMVEAMLFGIYPITTPSNSQAIGLDSYPSGETAKDIVDFVLDKKWQQYDSQKLLDIVQQKHSLESLIRKMLEYINDKK